jgi:phosphatidylglycerol---prolipoprotein diacylglyceryl transferase
MLPKLISIGSFFIPTYGTLVAIGFLAALWIITRLAKRASLPSESITNLAIYCALAGLAGAAASDCFHWKLFKLPVFIKAASWSRS